MDKLENPKKLLDALAKITADYSSLVARIDNLTKEVKENQTSLGEKLSEQAKVRETENRSTFDRLNRISLLRSDIIKRDLAIRRLLDAPGDAPAAKLKELRVANQDDADEIARLTSAK